MAHIANIDVIEFFRDRKKQQRVYYQYGDDSTIREACYQEEYGWFVRGDGVVTREAKSDSPIAATWWVDNEDSTKVCSFTRQLFFQ